MCTREDPHGRPNPQTAQRPAHRPAACASRCDRFRLRRHRRRGAPAPRRDHRLRDPGAGRLGRRHLARQQLPGLRLRRAVHLYSFSFALNPEWPRSFSGQADIRAYLEQVTDTYGLGSHLRFNHEVVEARWESDAARWRVTTSQGQWTADAIVSATGPLSAPQIPELPGLADFPGKVFHSSQWDHDYDLAGKRVAVVGTGASAIQIVPSIQPKVGRLTVFQRTPAWVLPKVDREISALEKALHRAVPATTALRRAALFAVREIQVDAFVRRPALLKLVQRMAERQIAQQIKDPVLRAKLTPDYRIGCKRILLSQSYYPALAAPTPRWSPAVCARCAAAPWSPPTAPKPRPMC